MRILKILLSCTALVLALFGTGQATGVFHFSDAVVQLLLATGGVFGVLGVQPVTLPSMAGKIVSALSVLVSALITVHLSGKLGGPERLYHIVGVVGTLLGIAGHSFMPSATPVPPGPPATPPTPAPAA